MTLRWLMLAAIGACATHSDPASDAAPRSVSCALREPSAHASGPFTLVTGSVYVGSWNGGNVVVSKGVDGFVVVDPRSPELDRVLETWAPGAARTVIDTHSHRDHTLGNGAVAKGKGAIIAQAEVKTRLAAQQVFQGAPVSAAEVDDWPTRTYRETLTLTLNGEEIELSYPPGAHTDGDTVVFFHGSHVVGTGDVFFPNRFPYVDPDAGGRVDALVSAIDEYVRAWPADTRIVPGHGKPVCTMADLRAYQQMLHDSITWVRAGQKLGLSPDSLGTRGAPAEYRQWAWSLVPESLWVSLVARAQ